MIFLLYERVREDVSGTMAWKRFAYLDYREDEIGVVTCSIHCRAPSILQWLLLLCPRRACDVTLRFCIMGDCRAVVHHIEVVVTRPEIDESL